MEHDHRAMLEVLKSNKGFEQPDKWLQYAIDHKFEPVNADKIDACPDCGGRSAQVIGQIVYYSTLLKLKSCSQCQLVFVDARIDPKVLQSHFESAYKDETYFLEKRDRIFAQIAQQVDSLTGNGGSVLDVGGAKGHLMAKLKQRRPDLKLTVNDLSRDACDSAAREYGFDTVVGGVSVLNKLTTGFDTVVMSDVIYYEPEINRLFEVMPRLVNPGGAIIIRVPNKLWLIQLVQFLKTASNRNLELQGSVALFNPEHLYIFSQGFLKRRLRSLGFTDIEVLPSRMLIEKSSLLESAFYGFSKALEFVSFGKLVLTSAILVVAKMPGHKQGAAQ